jgi:hypothetical protein
VFIALPAQCRQNLLRAASELNDRAHQFRVIEKRLLVRFKDRNPAPLNNLDVLLQNTHEQLIVLGNKVCNCPGDGRTLAPGSCCVRSLALWPPCPHRHTYTTHTRPSQTEKCQNDLANASNRLSCATHLLLMLMRYALCMCDSWQHSNTHEALHALPSSLIPAPCVPCIAAPPLRTHTHTVTTFGLCVPFSPVTPRFRFGLDEDNFNVLKSHLCPEMIDTEDQVR